jgi:hypothetical protein
MGLVYTGVKAHDDFIRRADVILQAANIGADAATIRLNEISFYQGCLQSAIANGCGVGPFIEALLRLGATVQLADIRDNDVPALPIMPDPPYPPAPVQISYLLREGGGYCLREGPDGGACLREGP